MKKIDDDVRKELVFTLVTHAPVGTLGDVSWSKKYIEQTLESYQKNSQTKVKFNLVVAGVSDKAMKDRINAVLGENPPYNVIYESGDDKDFFNQPEFKNSSAFIFYAFQLTSDTHLQTIKRLNVPVFIVNHYNFDASTDKRFAEKKEQWMSSLYTGFGPKSLGLNIKNLEKTSQNVSVPKDDIGVYRLIFNDPLITPILTKEITEAYSEKRALFFGYVNKFAFSESKRNLANPTEFAKSCIAKSQTQNPEKDIDILIRLNDSGNVWDSSYWSEFAHYSQIEQHFRSNHAGLTVAIYKKNAEGELVLKKTFGHGKTNVRIIDPFPITHNSMLNMMQLSDPFCLMTGCESFIESLSCNKLPLYQIVHWHDRLYNELLKEIGSTNDLGDTSLLYQYFALQDKSKGTTYAQLERFLCEHEPELLKQLQVFKQHLLVNKQLGESLHNKIDTLTINPEEYILQCLDVKYIVDLNDEPELTTKIASLPESIIHLFNTFPQHKELICRAGAQLLTTLVKNEQHNDKTLSDFIKGCKQFKDHSKAYNLLTDMLSQVPDPDVKRRIIDAEWSYFTSQLTRTENLIKRKYSLGSKQYNETMSQLSIIKEATDNTINSLLTARNQKEQGKALVDFYDQIKIPVEKLDKNLEKNLLHKTVDCLFKLICAVLGLPVILVLATTKKGRKQLNNFFFSDDNLEKTLPDSVKDEQHHDSKNTDPTPP